MASQSAGANEDENDDRSLATVLRTGPVRVLRLVAAVGVVPIAWMLLYAQQIYFGLVPGNAFFVFELTALVALYRTFSLVRKDAQLTYLRWNLFLIGYGLSFLAWLLHPEQVISRVQAKEIYWEVAVDARTTTSELTDENLPSSDEQSVSPRDLRRCQVELAAARLESRAALLRFLEIYRKGLEPATLTWHLTGLAAIFLAAWIASLRLKSV